jgi:anti-sigma factor RsiW
MSRHHERIEALLVDEAIGDISAEERLELDRLLREHEDVDRYAFERAAAAVFLAGAGSPSQSMPVDLTAKLVAAGERLVAEKG